MYLHTTIKLSHAGVATFLAVGPKLRKILEAQGWKLERALLSQTGRMNTVYHIWELRNMNHYQEAVAKLTAHPEFGAVWKALSESVVEETVAFCDSAPYA